jgi:hypothetical protein
VRAWLRSNRWFLVALLVLTPAATVVALLPRWFPYWETVPVPQDVPRGEVVSYAGAEIQLVDLEILDGAEWGTRPGIDLVVATIAMDVARPTESTYCDVTLTSDDSGETRTWNDSLSAGSYRIPDEYAWSCSFATAGTSTVQLTFLVPHGEVRSPTVVLSSSQHLPRALRLH